jgi:hypothetical protein
MLFCVFYALLYFFRKNSFFQAKKRSGSTAIFDLSKKINIFQDCKNNPTFYKHYLTIQGVMRALYAFGKGSEEKNASEKSSFLEFFAFFRKMSLLRRKSK